MKKIGNTIYNSLKTSAKKLVIIFLIIITIVLAFFTFRYQKLIRENKQYKEALQATTSELDQTMQQFTIVKDRMGEEIALQDQIIMSQRNAIHSGLIKIKDMQDKNLKNLQTIARAEERISNLEKILMNYDPGTIVIDIPNANEREDTVQCLELPARFSYNDEWITISAIIHEHGVVIPENGLSIVNKPKFTFGKKNKHESRFRNFFSSPEKVMYYENKNPYATTEGISNIVIEDEKKLHQTNGFWAGTGAALVLLFTFII